MRDSIQGDAFAAGGSVEAKGTVHGSLYAVGGKVEVQGRVERDLRAAGGDLLIARDARIDGKATLAGGHVVVEGPIRSHLSAAGGSVLVDAPIAGNVEVFARDVDIGPRAEISGTLTYWSEHPARIDAAANISGAVLQRQMSVPQGAYQAGIAALVIGGVVVFLGFAALGTLMVFLLPNATANVARALATNPGRSLLFGMGMLMAVPMMGVLFMITIIGIPIGLLVFLLYVLALMIGYVTVAYFIGEHLVNLVRKGKPAGPGYRVLGFITALALLASLQTLPFVGALIALVVVLMGLGAWTLSLYNRYYSAHTANSSVTT